jgi:hypothetical protein
MAFQTEMRKRSLQHKPATGPAQMTNSGVGAFNGKSNVNCADGPSGDLVELVTSHRMADDRKKHEPINTSRPSAVCRVMA